MNNYSAIPSVDYLLNLPTMAALLQEYGHQWCLQATREVFDEIRSQVANLPAVPTEDEILS